MFVWQTQLPGAAAIFYIKLVRLIDAGTCGCGDKILTLILKAYATKILRS